ncbi:hypothetical protein TcasGA2_TC034138 [Tribolium castaneum]|uniref:Gustatory receptor n=1 Tax=Tribolium castaneum TaxID=7070 RepID=A0A139WCX2_TRICA|nr:hypothetical protein TcasGA2_TC034138 [Tribolium castaneum]
MTTGGTIVLIWLCDSVLVEAEKLTILAQKLHRKTVIRNYQIIISDMTANFPKFYVGRFVVITRSTVYHIFSIIFTYLIVMIQFKEKLVVNAM